LVIQIPKVVVLVLDWHTLPLSCYLYSTWTKHHRRHYNADNNDSERLHCSIRGTHLTFLHLTLILTCS